MIAGLLLLILSAGVPYYLLLEKSKAFGSKTIFLFSGTLLLCAVLLSKVLSTEPNGFLVFVAWLSALYSIYRASKTTNFYKLGYYLIFVNAPFFMLVEGQGVFYGVALLTTLAGIYLMAQFYEKHYGSANYRYITGITLATPGIGAYLSFYLISIALYPPFPNALFFLSYILQSDPVPLWYLVVITLFFGNFYLAMRVMTTTVFGRPNANIHYVDMSAGEKVIHSSIALVLLVLSIIGLKETLS